MITCGGLGFGICRGGACPCGYTIMSGQLPHSSLGPCSVSDVVGGCLSPHVVCYTHKAPWKCRALLVKGIVGTAAWLADLTLKSLHGTGASNLTPLLPAHFTACTRTGRTCTCKNTPAVYLGDSSGCFKPDASTIILYYTPSNGGTAVLLGVVAVRALAGTFDAGPSQSPAIIEVGKTSGTSLLSLMVARFGVVATATNVVSIRTSQQPKLPMQVGSPRLLIVTVP